VTLPTWFVALDETICFHTPAKTKKVLRIARDPRASFLVESGEKWAELCGVHLSGRIEAVADETDQAAIEAAMDNKYSAYRTARTDMPAATAEHYANRRYFRLVPGARILTWDNSRMGQP
jgi:hypothetical protein